MPAQRSDLPYGSHDGVDVPATRGIAEKPSRSNLFGSAASTHSMQSAGSDAAGTLHESYIYISSAVNLRRLGCCLLPPAMLRLCISLYFLFFLVHLASLSCCLLQARARRTVPCMRARPQSSLPKPRYVSFSLLSLYRSVCVLCVTLC